MYPKTPFRVHIFYIYRHLTQVVKWFFISSPYKNKTPATSNVAGVRFYIPIFLFFTSNILIPHPLTNQTISKIILTISMTPIILMFSNINITIGSSILPKSLKSLFRNYPSYLSPVLSKDR